MSVSEPDPPEREPPDLRLLPLVAGLWISQAAMVGSQPGSTLRWAALGVALVVGALGTGAVLARGERTRHSAGRSRQPEGAELFAARTESGVPADRGVVPVPAARPVRGFLATASTSRATRGGLDAVGRTSRSRSCGWRT